MRKIKRTALLALSISLAINGMSYAEGVLDKVPAGALAVVKVSNLSQTSAKVAKLAETLGVNAFVPQLNDPLGALKKQLKITGGLKDDGELAFVYLDPKGGEEGKSMIVLVPTSDYASFVKMEGATADGEFTVVKGQDGQDMFIANWDGYAAVSPMKELITSAPSTALKLPARATKELAGNDLALFANFEALRGPLTADLAKNRETAKSEMLEKMKEQGEVPEKYHPVASAAFDQVFNAFETFLRDSDAATIGIKIGDTGISQNVVAEFKEGSYLGKVATGLKNDNATLLTNLPVAKYLVFGGSSIQSTVLNQLIDDLAGPVVKALPSDDEQLKIVPEYIASIKKLIGEMKSASFGMIASQGAIGQEPVIQSVSSIQGNAANITAQFKEMNDKYSKVMNELMTAGQEGVEINQTTTPNAKEINGVKFDSVTTEFVGDSPMVKQQQDIMKIMYGQPKVEMFIGSAGNSVLSYVGASEDSVKALIDAAKGNTSPLAEQSTVSAVSKQLPGSRIAEAYVQVDEIAAFALRAANQFGFVQGTIQLPPDLQPVGLSLSSEGNALEFNYYISNDLLQALVSGALQMSQLMQGGGGGNDGGL